MAAVLIPEAEDRLEAQRTLTGGALACEALLAQGVDLVFGYPGGANLPFYRWLASYPGLRHVLVRHEQNGAHAADGYARATGRVGVCIATSGPGATNLLTGLATAFSDCVPVVAITGQVARSAIGTQAFQEVNVLAMVGPITKGAFQIRTVEEIPSIFAEAFRLARSGRPGPVLIDFPKDVQLATIQLPQGPLPSSAPPAAEPPLTADARQALLRAAQMLNQARRPVIVAGHGVVMANAAPELFSLARASGAPVGTTLLGLGAFSEDDVQSLGMVGMHGTVQANLALHHADVIVGVGMRFDDRVVGRPSDFAPQAKIVHVDVDPDAFGRVVRADVPVCADARGALMELAALARPAAHERWWTALRKWTDDHSACGDQTTAEDPGGQPTTPEAIRALRRVTGSSASIVADIGQHQMFVALHHRFERPGQFFTSGGLGTMGYALPAAMGVKAAHPGRTVWAVIGDGGFQMSASELSTLVANGLAVKIMIVNNQCLGMVRQWQELFYDHVYSHSILPQPNFEMLAAAHGVWATTVTHRDQLDAALREASLHPGPALVDVHVPMEETVYPMVAAGTTPGDVICVDDVDAAYVYADPS